MNYEAKFIHLSYPKVITVAPTLSSAAAEWSPSIGGKGGRLPRWCLIALVRRARCYVVVKRDTTIVQTKHAHLFRAGDLHCDLFAATFRFSI